MCVNIYIHINKNVCKCIYIALPSSRLNSSLRSAPDSISDTYTYIYTLCIVFFVFFMHEHLDIIRYQVGDQISCRVEFKI